MSTGQAGVRLPSFRLSTLDIGPGTHSSTQAVPMNIRIPNGMTRRHFLHHCAVECGGRAGARVPAAPRGQCRQGSQEPEVVHPAVDERRATEHRHLGPEARLEERRRVQADQHVGRLQICEHMPKTAKSRRSIFGRPLDEHPRGRPRSRAATTCTPAYIPNPTVMHPTFGSVVSYELGPKRPWLEIPAFVSIGGPSEGPGLHGDDAISLRRSTPTAHPQCR